MARKQNNIQTKARNLTCIWISTLLIITLVIIQGETGTRAQQTIISEDTTWTLANSPYLLSGNVLVENGASLTIEPGVEVKFDGFYYMQIEGTLIAEGNENNMITFTSNAESPAPGDWSKIKIMGNADNGSSFKYCRIEYAYTAIALDYIIFYAAPNISNCIFENNYGGGIEYYVGGESTISSHKQIANNTILNTSDGSGMYINFNVYSINASLLVSKNIMKYNDGNVIAFFAQEGKVTITNNILVKNDGPGIVGNGDNVDIIHSVINSYA